MKTTLVIMAAGIGSRFGGGIKQMEPLGPSGEIIIDYSIHDAIEAGFDKVVFIIRHDLEKDFKEVIGDRIAQKIEVEYAFQEKEDLPEGFSVGERKKPWGTGQAILSAINVVNEPFAVINADDYYGKEGFKVVHDWLVSGGATTDSKRHFCMAGFELRNTLSENGGVTRGVCQADENGFMTDILETENIEKIDGKAGVRTDNGINFYPDDTLVSMNMWGIGPDFIEGVLKPGFVEFLKNLPEGNIKAEYLLPMVIGELVEKGEADVKILHTPDKWFGVTYADDKYAVKEAFKDLVAKGVYPENIK